MNEVFSVECKNFPFALDENKIIFVEREYEWYINQYIGRSRKRIQKAFSNFNYEFCYLPAEFDETVVHIVRQLLLASRDINHALCKYAYMDGDKAVFYCVELDNDEKEESLAKQLYHFACWCTVDAERRVKWNAWEQSELAAKREEQLDECWKRNDTPHIQILNDAEGLEQLEEYFDYAVDEDECELSYSETQLRALRRLADDLRKMGVSEERIREAVEPEPELSRIEITTDYRILLPDLHKEIALKPITKAVFLLFLRHPKGINFKELDEYRDELTALYCAVTDRIDQRAINKTISAICSPLSNAIHEKCSRIRESITASLGPKLAASYCISGSKGESKRILIPEDLIDWHV